MLDGFFMLPLGVSAVTLGFGFLVALDQPPLDLRDSPLLVPIAQALVALPLVVRTLVPVLAGIDDRQRQAAASLGAGPLRTLATVDVPVLWRPLLAGAGFAFAVSLGEFGATSFLARDDAPTLPVVIFRLLGHPGESTTAWRWPRPCVLAATTALRDAARRAAPGPVAGSASDVLTLRDLTVRFPGRRRRRAAVDRVTLDLARRRGAGRARARRAAASRRCCGRSPGWSRSPAAASPGTAATWPGCRPTGAASR